jgi:hypothetical protein
MAHLLRYGAASAGSITKANPQHNFAHTHALLIYDCDAVYSMIPKNGCTTLRLSIALKNGMIQDASQWGWIHQNNDSFRPSLRELARASYRFAILRHPLGRLASCFLDKFVKRTPEAWQFQSATGSGDLGRLTFRRFCREIAKPQFRALNIHWRPQIDFLVYASYDDFFRFEEFGSIAPVLRARAGLELVDARPLARHDSSHYAAAAPGRIGPDSEIWQIEAVMMAGIRPDALSLYDGELRALVEDAFRSDMKLYEAQFGGQAAKC